eukprot:GFYU01003839.1.p1 GENE.GFYU01003839.1~~GFYU01003839.1.p1  ORF type:complete len:266 (-),score=50.37 GFYU01003839.1:178-975(-)
MSSSLRQRRNPLSSGESVASKSDVASDGSVARSDFKFLHLCACSILTVQGVLCYGTGLTYEADLTHTVLTVSGEQMVPKLQTYTTVNLVTAVWVFLAVCAMFHGLTVLAYSTFLRAFHNNCNPFRWVEYSISASIMLCVLSVLVGIYDIYTLILVFSSSASCMFFGLAYELTADASMHFIGWLPFTIVWGVIFHSYNTNPDLSMTIALLTPLMFALFTCFGLIQLFSVMGIFSRDDYAVIEYSFSFMSIATKTIMAVMVVFGIMM